MGLSCGHGFPSPTHHTPLTSFWQPLPPLCTPDDGPEPSPPVTMEPLVTEWVSGSGPWETCWRQSLCAISSRDSSADGHSVRAVCVRVVSESGVCESGV